MFIPHMQIFLCEIRKGLSRVPQMILKSEKLVDMSNFAKEVTNKSGKRVKFWQRTQENVYLKPVIV